MIIPKYIYQNEHQYNFDKGFLNNFKTFFQVIIFPVKNLHSETRCLQPSY